MPLKLRGSCRCGQVRFTVDSHAPVPFMLCYCSICRKTAGGGGFAINLHAEMATLKVDGETRVFHAEIEDGEGGCRTSTGERHFCPACGSALWVFSPDYPELVHPFASAIDSELPKPRERVHIMLKYKPSWVEPNVKKGDKKFDVYPDESIADWHKRTKMWVE